ncbi:CcoQ/FixQ family Cbb3-type cytochrome c oxidase assembly chaperone [Oceanospirillum beijerinckii]|uniref:CcoQ/FixQ family Cbb3-type cytochrome c oxidase assembly chaperone n=1 Tax=Oceanospirillum beijerinckii TaxID=64976 RepID=UPI0004193B63|nr:CcoQ/FixQ family Cbb3-type cytochrome c oxidase assembly chaperone [Oceanospirillum beijerinckii]MAC48443.1 CcoQ/FixQ family Cbb3-type cytochrome c oxidase assembly chaperone [Oceanospirillum sp.]
MDINTYRGILTILVMVGFISLIFWAYSKRRKNDFDEAANLPFADEDDHNLRKSELEKKDHE